MARGGVSFFPVRTFGFHGGAGAKPPLWVRGEGEICRGWVRDCNGLTKNENRANMTLTYFIRLILHDAYLIRVT